MEPKSSDTTPSSRWTPTANLAILRPHQNRLEYKIMKKRLFILTLASLTFVPTLFAGGPGVFGTIIRTDDFDESYGIGAKLDVDINDLLTVEVRTAFYDTLGKGLRIGSVPFETDLEIVPLEVGLAIDIPIADRLQPYIGGGLGWYILEADVAVAGRRQEINIDDELGFYAVGGLRLGLNPNLELFGEYQYRNVETTLSNDSFSNRIQSVDVGLSGSSVNVGLLLRW